MDRSNKIINKVDNEYFISLICPQFSIPDCKAPAAGCRMEGAAEEPGNNLKIIVIQ